MEKKNRDEQSRIVDTLLAIAFSLIIGYVAITLFQSIQEKSTFLTTLLDFKSKIPWLMNLDSSYRTVILILILATFVMMASASRKKGSGYKDAAAHGAHGDAVFSSMRDIRTDGLIAPSNESKWSSKDPLKTLSVSEGIILGRIGDELVIIPPNSTLDNRNVFMVGSSGSGKGQAFVNNNIINNKTSTIIVTDPKGELYEHTADIKRDQGYRVYQIDFLNLEGDGYNPLDYVYDDMDAKQVALSIARNSSKDDKEDHWFVKGVDLLTGIIIYAKYLNPDANIPQDVKRIFNKINEDEDYLTEVCDEIGEEHPAFQYLKDASVASGNERQSILSTFTKLVGVFSSQKVSQLTQQSGINFHDFQEHKSILYIKIPLKNNPVEPLTATFVDQLFSTLYKIGDLHGAVLKIPTIVLFDEFANIGKLNDYDNILSTCRGYNMSLITVVQDLAQLEVKYGKELTRTIINNHDTTLFLRTKDPDTAKYFERIAGPTTIRFNTKSSSNTGGLLYLLGFSKASPSKSTNEQLISKPLISEAELLNMKPVEKCYVFMAGHKVEMKKAYQSLIFKGFITGTEKKLVDGVMKYPYVYPENRDSYIKRFKLEPYKDEITKEIEEVTSGISEQDHGNLAVATKPSIKQTQEIKESERDQAIQSVVTNFFEQIQKKNVEMKVAATTEAESELKTNITSESLGDIENIQNSLSDVDLAKQIVEEIQESNAEQSSPDALSLLKSISVIPEQIDLANIEVENIVNMTSMLEQFSISDQATNPEPIVETKKEDPFDELPF